MLCQGAPGPLRFLDGWLIVESGVEMVVETVVETGVGTVVGTVVAVVVKFYFVFSILER